MGFQAGRVWLECAGLEGLDDPSGITKIQKHETLHISSVFTKMRNH
jgi:hypothetical protein